MKRDIPMRQEIQAPKLSIVIASHNAREVIQECLIALQEQKGREDSEIIVADSSTDGTDRLVQERFPDVRLGHYAESLTIPRLRGAGISIARGEIIAILDPYCIADGHWIGALLKAHADHPEVAIGGCVGIDNAVAQPLVRWATYFSEYADFVPPVAAGQASVLTANNIAYKRSALGDVERLKEKGFWKAFANEQLLAEGHRLWTEPALVVKLRKAISFQEFLVSRYHHGRCYAAMRIAEASPMARLLHLLSIPLLPFLFLWRQIRSVWPKQQYRKTFVLVIPYLFLFSCSWAWGELWGYLRGPGRSCGRLYF